MKIAVELGKILLETALDCVALCLFAYGIKWALGL